MKIAVCDSSCEGLKRLIITLRLYFSNKSELASIYGYFCVDNLLSDVRSTEFDIIFLEADCNEKEIFAAAKRIWQANFCEKLVLMGSSSEKAIFGYAVKASGFLLKPIETSKLFKMMDRLSAERSRAVSVKSNGVIRKILCEDITYIESCKNGCELHTISGEIYKLNRTISSFESVLDKSCLRCHRSYIVNLRHVTSVDEDFTLSTGEKVLIRQKELHFFKSKFQAYISDKQRNDDSSDSDTK